MSNEGGSKAIAAALAANMGIAVTKFIAFLLTKSSSMLAESIHSVADCGNQVLLLRGSKRSKKTATQEHPFGFGRERYVYGFLVSIVMFTLGGLASLYEGYEKVHESLEGVEPEMVCSKWWWVPIVVVTLGILMEGSSFLTAVKQGKKARGGRSWRKYIQTAKSPEIPVVLMEDFAALIGLVIALVGVVMTLVTKNGIWDALGSGAIGLLLLAVASTLLVEMKSLLVGEAGSPDHVRTIREEVESAPGIERVIYMKTMHLGPEELLVTLKFAVARDARGEDIAASIDDAERRARSRFPDMALQMYLEPDIDAGHTEEDSIGNVAPAHHEIQRKREALEGVDEGDDLTDVDIQR